MPNVYATNISLTDLKAIATYCNCTPLVLGLYQ